MSRSGLLEEPFEQEMDIREIVTTKYAVRLKAPATITINYMPPSRLGRRATWVIQSDLSCTGIGGTFDEAWDTFCGLFEGEVESFVPAAINQEFDGMDISVAHAIVQFAGRIEGIRRRGNS